MNCVLLLLLLLLISIIIMIEWYLINKMQHETLTLFDNFSVKDVKACDSLSSMSSFQGTPVKPMLT